jgi:hypothetical protein
VAALGDWPARVPVMHAEIDVLEAWFGYLFGELFERHRLDGASRRADRRRKNRLAPGVRSSVPNGVPWSTKMSNLSTL